MSIAKKSKKRTARRKKVRPVTVSKKKRALKKAAAKPKSSARKTAKKKGRVRGKPEFADTLLLEPRGLGARSAGQAGDLQGLSGSESAASESVEELLEEGNAFEAGIVEGVEDAERSVEVEAETREIPEDDVPGEYRDDR